MKPYRVIKHVKFFNKLEFSRLCLKRSLEAKNILSSKQPTNQPANKVESFFSKHNFSSFFPRASALSKKKNFCFLTNRSRSVLSKFKHSRIAFRELASFCKINGLRKSSW